MSKTHAVSAAAAAIAMLIATMPTPAAAQYNYGPPPIGGPIGAILDSIFGPLPPPPPPYYDQDEYGPPPCYGCPLPPSPSPQATPPVRANPERRDFGGPYTRDREDRGDY
jgi:hypothetical protein